MQCNHCQDESRCERMGICQAFRLLPRVEPLPAQAGRARDVPGILHFLTPKQMAEEIVRLDAVIAGQAPNIVMGRLPSGAALPALTDEDRSDLRVGACVFRVPPYDKNPQSQRIADLMLRLAAGVSAPEHQPLPPSPGQQWKCGDEDGVGAPDGRKG